MIRKRVLAFIVALLAGLLAGQAAGHAEWVHISKGIDEPNIAFLAADPKNPKVIFAAAGQSVYKTEDAGLSWGRVLSIRGSARVNFIYASPFAPGEVYVGTDKGLKRSSDGGRRWRTFFGGVGRKAKEVLCAAAGAPESKTVWVGTGEGLFLADPGTGDSRRVENFPQTAVRSILVNGRVWAATDRGIYESADKGGHWQRASIQEDTSLEAAEVKETAPLEQFDIEESSPTPAFTNLVYMEKQKKLYAASRNGILEKGGTGADWNLMKGQNLPSEKINFIAGSSETLYAATDRGVFQWQAETNSFKEIYKGIDSKEVRAIVCSQGGEYLLAATTKGVFKYIYPELDLSLLNQGREMPIQPAEILARFQNEPSILEIQNAAVRYAEVHPSKIENWRRAAALKALLPSLSIDRDISRDENVDIDRGGTGDPDEFITGPEEASHDWSVGVSWDLGDLIWNDDQTSIDTRSRLMVELRDDILDQVTHLYYERRRLQVEMVLLPAKDLPLQIERQIRLEELTAGIDALTGGYLSGKLAETEKSH